MRSLIIIFGQIRTLTNCLPSILNNILIPNSPCDVILSIDGYYHDIPLNVLHDLKLYLIDIYTTQNKDISRDNQRIEFELVREAFQRIKYPDIYTFALKIRTDIYIKYPIELKLIYGTCYKKHFENRFYQLIKHTKTDWKMNPSQVLKEWFLTGSFDFFISRQLDILNPPCHPWSIQNIYQWNQTLFQQIDELCEACKKPMTLDFIQYLIRQLSDNAHIVYLIGSTWIHFGRFNDIMKISTILCDSHTKMNWPNHDDNDILQWIDHKGKIRQKLQKEWKLITDDQIRLVHHINNYHLMDLVNNDDYIESFDATHTLSVNKKNPKLFAWIVRHTTIH